MSAYKWVGRVFSVKADVVGNEIENLERQNGEVTKQAIVDTARPEESPIHGLFEWDDAVAGEKFRLHQAGQIITCLVRAEDETKEPQKAFINVVSTSKKSNKGAYVSFERALNDDEMREIVLSNAYAEMRLFKSKYQNLKECAGVVASINDALGFREEQEAS